MFVFWVGWVFGLILEIVILAVALYVSYLVIKALRKYISEGSADVKEEKLHPKWPGVAIAAGVVIVTAAAGAVRKGAAAVSVIGGADGPTSIFVAGKLGGAAAIIGTVSLLVNLTLVVLVVYIAILIIRALRKYLRS